MGQDEWGYELIPDARPKAVNTSISHETEKAVTCEHRGRE